jgi:hypothetical protein
MTISVEKLLNNSRLHSSGSHGNTSGLSSEFEKISVFLCRQGVGRQLAPIQMTRQHRLDEILDKEIVCIQSASVRTLGKHRPNAVLDKAIMCRQVAAVQVLGQHRLDATLIWKRVKRVMERQLHS